MPNNEKDYGFGRTTVEGNDGWYPTKQKPTTSNLYPYNHIDDLINEKLEQHLRRTDNPHLVTLQQLGVDHLFTHSIRVEYEKDKPLMHLILLDLNGNPVEDVGPIDIDLAEYTEEQLEAIREELKEYVDSKVIDINNKLEELTAKTNTLEGEITELREYVDNVITETITLLENEITEIKNEIAKIISELSIEELSKRDYYDPDENPDDRYELATEFDPEQQYYERVYDVDDTRLEGMWQLPEELNYVNRVEDLPWWNTAYGYYYNSDGSKVDFDRFGCLAPRNGQQDRPFYGVAVSQPESPSYYGYEGVARYSYGTDHCDYNPFGAKGYTNTKGQPNDAMRLLYFESSQSSEAHADRWKFLGATKVSDTLLEYGDNDYLMKYNPITITEEEFEPNKYYIKKTTVTEYELVTDSDFDPEKHYYQEVYDVDSSNLRGTWKFNLNSDILTTQLTWNKWTEIMEDKFSFSYSGISSYWFTPNGTKKSFTYFGIMMPVHHLYNKWDADKDGMWAFGVSNRYYANDNEYIIASSIGEARNNGAILLPIIQTRRYANLDDTIDYNPVGDPGYVTPGFDTINFNISIETEESKALASRLFSRIAEKVSDTPKDYGDTDYKTKFVPIILTEETYEPNKYYIRKEIPIAKVTRIELGEDSSTYRDSLGNDVLKIVKNNVLLNGDILAPDLKVVNNTQTTVELENNAEKTFSNTINNLTITIPDTVKHGFTSYIVLEPSASFSANIVNNSSFNLRIIKAGSTVSTLDFEPNCQYNLLFLCNGVNLELYVQEIVIE